MGRRVVGLALLAIAGGALGIGLGVVLGYDALAVIVPVLCLAAAGMIARSALPLRSRPLLPAAVVQGGYALWLLQGVLALGRWGGLVDVVPLTGALLWVVWRPERRPFAVLAGVHAVEIVLHFIQLGSAEDPSAALPWLTAHVGLRLLGLALTWRGLQTIWRRARR